MGKIVWENVLLSYAGQMLFRATKLSSKTLGPEIYWKPAKLTKNQHNVFMWKVQVKTLAAISWTIHSGQIEFKGRSTKSSSQTLTEAVHV